MPTGKREALLEMVLPWLAAGDREFVANRLQGTGA